MAARTPPPTAEGWYVLHDMRRIDWDSWRDRSEDDRRSIIEEAEDLLSTVEAVDDADDGASAHFVGLGHEVDLMGIHFRPALGDLDRIERRIELSRLGEITDRTDSYLSVTEVSGYLSREYFDGDAEVDPGVERYIQTRLHPSIPAVDVVSFYPMSKRRGEVDNWFDLQFDERAEHIAAHGEIGKRYAGKVTQVVSGSIGLDDWEWGITLFADDITVVKDLLYEMRFDTSTSRFAEFGPFTLGRRIAPTDLGPLLAGEPVGAGAGKEPTAAATGDAEAASIREELAAEGLYTGVPHGEDIHALVLYSDAEEEPLVSAVDDLAGNFDHYDTHVDTGVYGADEQFAVVSLWETTSAAETAAGFLAELPEVVDRPDDTDGWETMGMFYKVKPDHRDAFVETFAEVEGRLEDMDGHRTTTLFVRVDDDCDMFISSRWDAREDAMGFFGSEAFRETVRWGRDVLQRRPRHVFLA